MEGFILVYKPAGLTSHDVIDRIRKITGIRKVGHAGTLDPFATGLLLIAIGSYTKKLQAFVGLDKTYEARLRLGAVSETYDTEGAKTEIITEKPDDIDETRIETVLSSFRGGYLQKAPIFSAKKIKGRKLYELARKGEATESLRPEKQVEIHALTLNLFSWPHLDILVSCGSGTYIRSLAHDIGTALGTGAYAETLRRTKIGPYSIENSLILKSLNKEQIGASLLLDMDTDD